MQRAGGTAGLPVQMTAIEAPPPKEEMKLSHLCALPKEFKFAFVADERMYSKLGKKIVFLRFFFLIVIVMGKEDERIKE